MLVLHRVHRIGPQSLSEFIAGVIRYQWRVITGLYVWAEPYPPFAPIPQGFADPGGYPAELNVAPGEWGAQPAHRPGANHPLHPTVHRVVRPEHRQRNLPPHLMVYRPVHRRMEPFTEELLRRRVPVAASCGVLLLAAERRLSTLQPGALGVNEVG